MQNLAGLGFLVVWISIAFYVLKCQGVSILSKGLCAELCGRLKLRLCKACSLLTLKWTVILLFVFIVASSTWYLLYPIVFGPDSTGATSGSLGPPEDLSVVDLVVNFVVFFITIGLGEEVVFRGLTVRLPAPPQNDAAKMEEQGDLQLSDISAQLREIQSGSPPFPSHGQQSTLTPTYAAMGNDSPLRPPIKEQFLNILAFVIYHLDYIHNYAVFSTPRFLVSVAILGFCCQEALIRTGSLWSPIFIHALPAWIYAVFGGGRSAYNEKAAS